MSCNFCEKPEMRGCFTNGKRQYTAAVKKMKRQLGCIGVAKEPIKFGDHSFHTCPHKTGMDAGFNEYFRAYTWVDANNILPFGELWQQSEKTVAIFELIRSETRAIEREKIEKQNQEMKKKSKGGRKNPMARKH